MYQTEKDIWTLSKNNPNTVTYSVQLLNVSIANHVLTIEGSSTALFLLAQV